MSVASRALFERSTSVKSIGESIGSVPSVVLDNDDELNFDLIDYDKWYVTCGECKYNHCFLININYLTIYITSVKLGTHPVLLEDGKCAKPMEQACLAIRCPYFVAIMEDFAVAVNGIKT